MKLTIHRRIAPGLSYTVETDLAELTSGGQLAQVDAAVRAALSPPDPTIARQKAKRIAVEHALASEPVLSVLVDARYCAGFPAKFACDNHVALNLGRNLKPPMHITFDEIALSCVALFSGVEHALTIPWTALYAIGDEGSDMLVWAQDIPVEARATPEPATTKPEPAATKGEPARVLKLVPDEPVAPTE